MTVNYERLVSLGMSEKEATLLTTPIADLSETEVQWALKALDKRVEIVRKANETHVSTITPFCYMISDDLGVHGILNHANGKRYDSKSEYYKALKASGHEIVDQMPEPKKEIRGDYNTHEALKKAAQQTGFI